MSIERAILANPEVTGAAFRVVACALALANTGCAPTAYYFDRLAIDPTLHVRAVGARSILDEPKRGSYYFLFRGANLIMVDHFDRNRRSDKRERLLYLEANLVSVLDRTVKQDEILKGQYGELFATKTCFYTRPLNNGYSGISVGANGFEHETPKELSGPLQAVPSLTSVGLVRVFQADPEYVIVSGNYEPNGKLGSLHLDTTKDGESVGGSLAYFVIPLDLKAMYGIPERLDIRRYIRSHGLALPPTQFPEVAVMMIQFFGYGSLIRVDELSHGGMVSSRFLQPSVTEEEQILNAICEARFHQQKADCGRWIECGAVVSRESFGQRTAHQF